MTITICIIQKKKHFAIHFQMIKAEFILSQIDFYFVISAQGKNDYTIVFDIFTFLLKIKNHGCINKTPKVLLQNAIYFPF
jgi:hypothetical protein